MVDVWACVIGKMSTAGFTQEQIDGLTESFRKLVRAYPNEPAEALAGRVEERLRQDRRRLARAAADQLDKQTAIEDALGGLGTDRLKRQGLRSVMSMDPLGLTGFNNFEARRDTYYQNYISRMHQAVQELSPRWFNTVQNRPLIDDVGRALMGNESVSAGAKGLAGAIRRGLDQTVLDKRDLGVNIGYRPDWLPVLHSADKVARASAEEWKRAILDKIDRSRMIDRETGEPFEDDALDRILDKLYERITTHDMSELQVGIRQHPEAFIRRIAHEQFFQWKSYEAWKAYQEEFGNGGNLMEVVVHHLTKSARDAALISTLGPDPASTVEMMKQLARKSFPGKSNAVETSIQRQWEVISGAAAVPESHGWALAEDTLFAGLRLAQLGGAGLASVMDLNFAGMARHFNGLGQVSLLPQFVEGVATFATRSKSEAQRFNLEHGVGSDVFLSSMHGNARMLGDFDGLKFVHKTQDAFFRANGLKPLTEATKTSVQVEARIVLAREAGKPFERIDKGMARALQRFGVTEDLWRAMADPDVQKPIRPGVKGLHFPSLIEKVGVEQTSRVMAFVRDVQLMSSPESTVSQRAWFYHGNRPGSVNSVLWRSATSYLQFPVSAFAQNILRRVYASDTPVWKRGTQVGTMMVVGTMMGAAVLQVRQVSQGKDPWDTEDPEFWLKAMLYSGVLGLAGDFIAKDAGAWEYTSIAGPGVDVLANAFRSTTGAATSLAIGDDVNVGRGAVRTLRGVVPGVNLPIVGLALNRLMLDPLQRLVDPDAQRSFQSQVSRTRSNTGQDFWWRPGETEPRRAPRLEEAFGG